MVLRVATVNVNGLRAAVRKGMLPWIEAARPDVITMQEVRAPDAEAQRLLPDGWHLAHTEASAAGRAGVAIATRSAPRSVVVDLPVERFVGSGRWIEAAIDTADGRGLTVISTYVHTGEATDPVRMEEKLAFLTAITDRIEALRRTGSHVLLTGDLNIAHRDVDLKNVKGNLGAAGCLPSERAHLDRWFGELGWVDLGRTLGGDGPGPFTWWSYRGRAYDNDAGWRIDYQIASPELAAMAKDAEVDRSASYADRWSDHAPLLVTFDC